MALVPRTPLTNPPLNGSQQLLSTHTLMDIWWHACWAGQRALGRLVWEPDFFLMPCILVEILRVCGEEVPFDKEGLLFGGPIC